MPPKPIGLSAIQAAKWNEISTMLCSIGLLTPLDGAALLSGILACCEYDDLERAIHAEGYVITRPVHGRDPRGATIVLYKEEVTNPKLKYRQATWRRMMSFLEAFGMTPAARARANFPLPLAQHSDTFDLIDK